MEQIIGYCGIVCSECPAYLATINNDDNARKKTAETWSKEFHTEIKPEDINCEGCHSTNEVLFNHCYICEIRKCGLTKNIANCGHCSDYSCEKLNKFHEMVPDAKKTLENVRIS